MLSRYCSRIDYFKQICRDKKVLHLGCSSGTYMEDHIKRGDFLHKILLDVADDVCGIDIHKESLEKMRRLGFNNLYEGDAQQLDAINGGGHE